MLASAPPPRSALRSQSRIEPLQSRGFQPAPEQSTPERCPSKCASTLSSSPAATASLLVGLRWRLAGSSCRRSARHRSSEKARQGPVSAVANSDPLTTPFRFGKWRLNGRMLLAPLESVSDCAYRKLCAGLGASFTWTEMTRAAAIARNNLATLALIDTYDPAVPTGVQILATKPDELRAALQVLEERSTTTHPHFAQGIHGVDLNFGCPSPSIISQGAGPALLRRPKRLLELFEVLAEWRARTSLPVGVIGAKLRLGLNAVDEKRNLVRTVMQRAIGRLDYITLHARHAEDMSENSARWERIREAKEFARNRLLVLGNGDVFNRSDAQDMMLQTGCDAVLVARGAIRTGGLIFDQTWRDDAAKLPLAADHLEQRYRQLAETYGGSKQKYIEYHTEAFRRLRLGSAYGYKPIEEGSVNG